MSASTILEKSLPSEIQVAMGIALLWLKATARWPELHDLMLFELDAAEKDAAARQRSFKLEGVA